MASSVMSKACPGPGFRQVRHEVFTMCPQFCQNLGLAHADSQNGENAGHFKELRLTQKRH
jgi:hypothetical protein